MAVNVKVISNAKSVEKKLDRFFQKFPTLTEKAIKQSGFQLIAIIKELTEKGVSLVATEQPISTKDATSKCFLDMLSVFSEFETNLRKERQMDGIAVNRHKFKGRQTSIDVERIKTLKREGLGATQIAREMDIDRTSVYRLLKRVEL